MDNNGFNVTYHTHLVDEFGNQIERTPAQYPYSYDGYVTYRAGKNEEANCTIYSDRLLEQDYAKTNELIFKHFGNHGQYWNDRKPKEIELFLSEWIGAKVKIIFIMQYCNVSSGYPTWRFDIHREYKEKECQASE